MALLRKADIAAPSIPSEEFEVAAWGGSVVVRAKLLEDYLADAAAADQGEYEHIFRTLAATVFDADGVSVLDADGWRAFAAGNRRDALALYEVAYRLSGSKAEAEKK
jgi:hypothetical protein